MSQTALATGCRFNASLHPQFNFEPALGGCDIREMLADYFFPAQLAFENRNLTNKLTN